MGAAGVGDCEVVRIAGVLHAGGVLVVDVHAVEAVLADERHGRVGEGADAGRVGRAVGIGSHRVEAAAGDALAAGIEEATGLRPAPDRDHGLDLRVLLLELVEQIEVTLVGVGRVHLGAGHAGPGQAGGGIGRIGGIADRDLVRRVHMGEGVVDMGQLAPGNVGGQIGRLAVLAGAPAGEVADHAARLVGAHLFAPLLVIDLAVSRRGARRGRQAFGAAALLADHLAAHRDAHGGAVGARALVVGGTGDDVGDAGAGRPADAEGGAGVLGHQAAVDVEADLGDVAVAVGGRGRQGHRVAGGRAGAGRWRAQSYGRRLVDRAARHRELLRAAGAGALVVRHGQRDRVGAGRRIAAAGCRAAGGGAVAEAPGMAGDAAVRVAGGAAVDGQRQAQNRSAEAGHRRLVDRAAIAGAQRFPDIPLA